MTKEAHVIRVWAGRGGRRTLELSLDALNARQVALARVRDLEADASVDEIEMREHTVLTEDVEKPLGMRRSLHWARTDGRWRRLPDTNVRRHPAHRPAPVRH
jgi:hypothetical protein